MHTLTDLDRAMPALTATGRRTFRTLSSKIGLGPSGCWLWKGALNRSGYGIVSWHGKARLAHRVVYVLLRGEIPAEREPDHLCKTRHCVNPDHIELVTHQENLNRGDSPPIRNRTATHCKFGHAFDAENTHIRPDGARHCRACSRRREAERRRSAA